MFTGILPLFILILAGFTAVKSGYVAADSMRPIGTFILKIALPALIFSAVTSVPLSEALNPGYLLGYLFGSLIAFGVGLFLMRRFFGMDLATSPIIALGTSLSNSGFMGFPIVLTVLGDRAATLLAQCMLVENIVMIPLALVLSESALAKGDGGWRSAVPRVLSSVLRNPIVIAVLAAVAFNLSGLAMPKVAEASIDLLAHVASPTALFVIGGTVASLPLAGVYRRVSVIVTAKLIFHPLMVFLMLSVLPGVSDAARIGGTLFAAVPMLSVYPIFGQRVGMELVTATAQMAATVASFITLAAALWLLTS